MHPISQNRYARAAIVLATVLVAAGGLCLRAHAQAWLPDRAYTEGPGIRVGDLELHPGVAVRGGYDSNVFRADGERRVVTDTVNGQPQTLDATQRVRGSGILAVTPHLHLSTLGTLRMQQGEDREGVKILPKVAFRGGLAGTYVHYFLDGGPKNFEADTDFWLGILPQRPFNVDLTFAYVRNVRPFTQAAGDNRAYRYNIIQPRVRFNFGSRSQVLTSYVGYTPRVTLYESDIFKYLNNLNHGIEFGASWRFLPSTALVYDGNVDLQQNDKEDPFATRSPVLFANSTRFRTRLGLTGAVTNLLTVRALVGYAAISFRDTNFHERLDSHEDVIGEAALNFRFGTARLSSFELGYAREIQPSWLGGWTRLDRGFAVLRGNVARVVSLSLEGGIAGLNYGRIWGFDRNDSNVPVPLGFGMETKRDDIRVDGAARAEYRATNWLSFMADVSVQTIITDFDYAVFAASGPIPDPAQYFAVTAFGGVRAHY